MSEGYGVSRGDLKGAGNALMDAAEAGKRGGSGNEAGGSASTELSGATSGTKMTAALDGFSLLGALRKCESQWEEATDWMLAKLSVAGDKIVLCAENYGENEDDAKSRFDSLTG